MVTKLSESDIQYLKLLTIDCETFHLNEKESLEYIARKLNRVSRKTYYCYKKEISDSSIYGGFFKRSSFFGKSTFSKSVSKIHLVTEKMKIVNSSSDMRIRSHNVWDDVDFLTRYYDRFFAEANDILARTYRLSGRINSQRALAEKNNKSIPSHATIREEYAKCGKPECNRCNHGPYYYGYWKENGKTKKKYIGKYDPREDTKKLHEEIHFQ